MASQSGRSEGSRHRGGNARPDTLHKQLNSTMDQKLALCAALEGIADGLPHSVDRLACLRIAAELVPSLRRIHAYEEEELFPRFVGDVPARAASVSRLCVEHVEDECFADELTEVLLVVGRGGAIENPEALGFMLRGFFQAVRRHAAFEAEHVLPLAGEGVAGLEGWGLDLERDADDTRPAREEAETLDRGDPFAQEDDG